MELGEVADDAVDMADPAAFVGDGQAGRLAEEFREVDAQGFVHQFDLELVGPAKTRNA